MGGQAMKRAPVALSGLSTVTVVLGVLVWAFIAAVMAIVRWL